MLLLRFISGSYLYLDRFPLAPTLHAPTWSFPVRSPWWSPPAPFPPCPNCACLLVVVLTCHLASRASFRIAPCSHQAFPPLRSSLSIPHTCPIRCCHCAVCYVVALSRKTSLPSCGLGPFSPGSLAVPSLIGHCLFSSTLTALEMRHHRLSQGRAAASTSLCSSLHPAHHTVNAH